MRSRPPLTRKQEEKLFNLYYNEGYLFGRDRLFEIIKERNLKISRRQLWDWLQKQEVHQIYRQAKKPKVIQPTVLKRPYKQIGIDLIDMQNQEYEGYRYILTAIDLFSKKAVAVPLKSKEDKVVVEGMKKVLDKYKNKISSVRSDAGSEFTNKRFKELLEKNEIKQVNSLAGKPQSNGTIERFNGVLKKLINKYMFALQNQDWPSVIDGLVRNYNKSKHRVTKTAPDDVSEKDFGRITGNIKESVTGNRKLEIPRYKKGDRVRVRVTDQKDKKNFSKKRYKVEKVSKPKNNISVPFYKIESFGNKKFYDEDLILANEVENETDEPEFFEVSKLIKPVVKDNEFYYEVRWKNERETTIEPRHELVKDVPKLVRKFERERKLTHYLNSRGKLRIEWDP